VRGVEDCVRRLASFRPQSYFQQTSILTVENELTTWKRSRSCRRQKTRVAVLVIGLVGGVVGWRSMKSGLVNSLQELDREFGQKIRYLGGNQEPKSVIYEPRCCSNFTVQVTTIRKVHGNAFWMLQALDAVSEQRCKLGRERVLGTEVWRNALSLQLPDQNKKWLSLECLQQAGLHALARSKTASIHPSRVCPPGSHAFRLDCYIMATYSSA
jgi:hypothetical protein